MDEIKREVGRRGVELVILPISEAIMELEVHPDQVNAILRVAC